MCLSYILYLWCNNGYLLRVTMVFLWWCDSAYININSVYKVFFCTNIKGFSLSVLYLTKFLWKHCGHEWGASDIRVKMNSNTWISISAVQIIKITSYQHNVLPRMSMSFKKCIEQFLIQKVVATVCDLLQAEAGADWTLCPCCWKCRNLLK